MKLVEKAEEENKGQSGGKNERREEIERGVHVSHSANKQKVNTSGGNTDT